MKSRKPRIERTRRHVAVRSNSRPARYAQPSYLREDSAGAPALRAVSQLGAALDAERDVIERRAAVAESARAFAVLDLPLGAVKRLAIRYQ
jgi:phage tail sheath protein FI